jgi:hypothetical protein
MDVKLEIPYGGSHLTLFISNIPAWFWWVIVVIAATYIALQRNMPNF